MITTVIAIGGAAALFLLFGLTQRHSRTNTANCACFGGGGHCAACPHMESEHD